MLTLCVASIRSISKSAVSMVGCVLLSVFMTGCGAETLQSVEITPTSASLVGIGATQQFSVVATYSSGRQADVTLNSTYTVATPNPLGPVTPDNAIVVNATGMGQSVLGACTWVASGTSTNQTFGTSPYILTATFDGVSGTSFVSAASLVGCQHP